MSDISKITLEGFTRELASSAPAPGGGGASALAGALGAALGAMAANLTKGKRKYADVDALMRESAERLQEISEELLRLIDADAQAFLPLAAAYSMPSETDEQRDEKDRVMQKALLLAAQPPLRMAELAYKTLEILKELSGKASNLVVSDVGCGAAMCRACARGAALNVYINARMIKDAAEADELFEKASGFANDAEAMAQEIIAHVEGKLCRRSY